MLKTLSLLINLVLCSQLLASPKSKRKVTEHRWGHINHGGFSPRKPMYLINKTREQLFRVCLPLYMTELYPGITEEIKAAINIWGYYIQRKIKIEVVLKDLKRPRRGTGVNTLSARYNRQCGEKFDVVVGLASMGGSTIAKTGFTYKATWNSAQKQKVERYKRYLFLRDFDTSNGLHHQRKRRWKSLASDFGTQNADAILRQLIQRQDRGFKMNAPVFMLTTLIHEFGHVWGMCDQSYSVSNCSSKHSTHKNQFSVMGYKRKEMPLYLTDDDIAGIRALAIRPGFDHGWHIDPESLFFPAQPINRHAIEFLKIINVRASKRRIDVEYGLVTRHPTRYQLEAESTQDTGFKPIGKELVANSAVEKMAIQSFLRQPLKDPYKTLRLRVNVQEKSGTWTESKWSKPFSVPPQK